MGCGIESLGGVEKNELISLPSQENLFHWPVRSILKCMFKLPYKYRLLPYSIGYYPIV